MGGSLLTRSSPIRLNVVRFHRDNLDLNGLLPRRRRIGQCFSAVRIKAGFDAGFPQLPLHPHGFPRFEPAQEKLVKNLA